MLANAPGPFPEQPQILDVADGRFSRLVFFSLQLSLRQRQPPFVLLFQLGDDSGWFRCHLQGNMPRW